MVKQKANKATKKQKGLVSNESFAKMVKGLVAQDIEFKEAVSTISIGIRQANGIPIKVKQTDDAAAELGSEPNV